VPPRVWYGTACLLIRDVVRSVRCSDEWEIGVVTHLGSHGARGAVVPRSTPENLSIAMVLRTTLAKPGIRPIVSSGPYTKGSFLVARAVMKSLLMDTRY
jgi:hypothetical protein